MQAWCLVDTDSVGEEGSDSSEESAAPKQDGQFLPLR